MLCVLVPLWPSATVFDFELVVELLLLVLLLLLELFDELELEDELLLGMAVRVAGAKTIGFCVTPFTTFAYVVYADAMSFAAPQT